MQPLFPAFLRLPHSKTLALEMVVPYTLRQGKLIKGHLDINHWQATRKTMSCELGKTSCPTISVYSYELC